MQNDSQDRTQTTGPGTNVSGPGRHLGDFELLCELGRRRFGLTRDFYSDAFDELRLPRSVRTIGSVETTRVEVRGVCRKCATNEKARSKTKKKKERKP